MCWSGVKFKLIWVVWASCSILSRQSLLLEGFQFPSQDALPVGSFARVKEISWKEELKEKCGTEFGEFK